VLEGSEKILEIAFAADAKEQDGTDIGYAIAIQGNCYFIKILYARRILDLKRKFIYSSTGPITAPALERADIAKPVAYRTRKLHRQIDLSAPASTRLIPSQADFHR